MVDFGGTNNKAVAPSETVMDQIEASVEDNVSERTVITDGEYVVDVENSIVNWSGKKPLIDGYINSGEISLTDGLIEVSENGATATGSFVIDMNTLKVGLTAKKPNMETTLEGHLKGTVGLMLKLFQLQTLSSIS